MNKALSVILIIAIILGLSIMEYQIIDIKNQLKNEQKNYQELLKVNSTNSAKNVVENNKATNSVAKNAVENNEVAAQQEDLSKSQNQNKENTVITKLSPTGFMGSSMNEVVLYSNKEVYVIKYDGLGYNESNILSKNLVAKNVDSIIQSEEQETLGGIIIRGGEKVNEEYPWIYFK